MPTSFNLTCELWQQTERGRPRYRGTVRRGDTIVFEGQWREKRSEAIADAMRGAAEHQPRDVRYVLH
jgi:hypothetical protein